MYTDHKHNYAQFDTIVIHVHVHLEYSRSLNDLGV